MPADQRLQSTAPGAILSRRGRGGTLSPARLINEATIFPIPLDGPGILAIAPRPRGGDWLDRDVRALAAHGLDVLVSLLEPHEALELGLEHEAAACDSNGLAFVSLPIPDRGTPSDVTAFTRAVAELVTRLRSGTRIAVHCRQSVGRSGLLAVSMAIAMKVDLRTAIETVSIARGVGVPETPAQLEWLREHQEALSRLVG
jgi:protein-tyrosine phosphatase